MSEEKNRKFLLKHHSWIPQKRLPMDLAHLGQTLEIASFQYSEPFNNTL